MSQSEIERLNRRIGDLEAELAQASERRDVSVLKALENNTVPAGYALNTLILESSGDCIAILDLEARTRFVSPGGILGMEISDVESIIGLSWLRVWEGPDNDAARAAIEQAKAGGVGRFQGFCPTHKGTPKWWDVMISAIPGPDGRPAHLMTVGRDISAAKIAEKRFRDSEENTKIITDALPILISFVDADRVYRFANAYYRDWFGKEPEQVLGKTIPEVIGSDLYSKRKPLFDRAFAGETIRFEAFRNTETGVRLEDIQYIPRRDPDGTISGIYVLGFDITQSKKAENEWRRLAAIVEQSTDFIGVARPDGQVEFVNEAGRRLVGLPDLEAARALPMIDYFAPDNRAYVGTTILPAVERTGYWEGEVALRNVATGAIKPMLYTIFPVRNADGDIFGYGTISRDLTESKKAEARQLALIELGDRLRDIGEPSAIIAAASEIMGRTLKVSRAGYGQIDCARETVTIAGDWLAPGIGSIAGILHFRDYGTYIDELKAGTPVAVSDAGSDSRTAQTAAALKAIAAQSFINFPVHEHGDFAALFFVNNAEPRIWSADDLSFVGKVADRTRAAIARLQAEASLRDLAASLEAQVAARTRERDRMWSTSQDLFVICGFNGIFRSANPAWTEALGFTVAELSGMAFDTVVHPADVDATIETYQQLRQGIAVRDFDIRLRAKDGTYRWFNWHCIPDADEFYAAGRDITARRELEDQLRQAQKMEAVGQLTGGIAHDFNNLLTGIVGSLDIMQTRIGQGRIESLDRYINGAMTSANRAAALTHRLLAFSRRQPLDPKPVDVNVLVTSLEDLLRRTMGETTAIEIMAGTNVWLTLCDPNQLESALLNLAINARDAMPDGGTLTIETANTHLDRVYVVQHTDVTPGHYVRITVTDTGTGMPPDVMARAFEPFFTTKPIGQGTGLGLSMIYGFARQSEGHATIFSEVDKGTTFKIYLPRFRGETASDDLQIADPEDARAEEGETIMVVEDEPIVRALIVETLMDLGYRVQQAPDGIAGLALLQSNKRIDLLVTDVGLPGLNGRQLAEKAREARPGLKVLFITGYAENAMFGNGHLAQGMQMITKPFSIDTLAQRVRDLIEG